MRTCVLFLALFGAAILGRAQAPCGADEVHVKAMEENPTYAMGFQASNAAWLNAPVATDTNEVVIPVVFHVIHTGAPYGQQENICLLYTSPSPRDKRQSRMPSSA